MVPHEWKNRSLPRAEIQKDDIFILCALYINTTRVEDHAMNN